MKITYDIQTKQVTGLPWDTEVEFTYFFAVMKIDGKSVSNSGIWCQDPTAAIESAINYYANQLKKEAPSGFAQFGDAIKPARGKARWENYRGYWILTTTEETT